MKFYVFVIFTASSGNFPPIRLPPFTLGFSPVHNQKTTSSSEEDKVCLY